MTDWQQFYVKIAKAVVPLAASVVSFVLGWRLNSRTDERKENSIRQREEIGRQSERNQKREDRREAFELEVMKELHTALVTYARSQYLLLRSLEMQAGSGGSLKGLRFGSEEDSNALVAGQNLNRLRGLVLDDGIRASVGDCRTLSDLRRRYCQLEKRRLFGMPAWLLFFLRNKKLPKGFGNYLSNA